MDRAWARVPLTWNEPYWSMDCPCLTNSTQKEGMVEAVEITFAKIHLTFVEKEGTLGPFPYWLADCDRCNVVYWAAP